MANGNMLFARASSRNGPPVGPQAWTINNQLASGTKADLNGSVLAITNYAYNGDGTRVRKDDPDGTTLYGGPVEQTIGPGGTAMAEYYDDISGPTLTGYVTTRSEPVVAGLQRSYTTTPPLPTMGDAPLRLRSGQARAIRWQLWLTVPVTDTYTLAVFADDGFSFPLTHSGACRLESACCRPG